MNAADWVKDGTTSADPVTASTPEIVVAAAVDPVKSDPEAPATPPAVIEQPPVKSDPEPPAQPPAIEDFIEARRGDQPYQLPKDVLIPFKRGEDVEWVTVAEAQKRGMLEKDYRVKTAEAADLRRQYETALRVTEARRVEMEKWFEEERQRQAQAYASPEDAARYEQYQELLRTAPWLKDIVNQAYAGRLITAEAQAQAAVTQEDALRTEATQLAQAIADLGQKYPTVDAEMIRERYALELQAEVAPLSVEYVESLYQKEAARLDAINARLTSPLQSKLDALSAQVQELTKGKAAEAHNEKTKQAIERTLAPVGAPVGGQPAAAQPAAATLTGKSMADRGREWARL
jgi:hypothetical protein